MPLSLQIPALAANLRQSPDAPLPIESARRIMRPVVRRLLIIGWDAADWQRIDPLLASGRMPRLASLLSGGTRGDLSTLQPILSPLLWTSVATGKTADRHGILNFVEPSPSGDGVRISASTSRRTKALWNILSQAGLRVHVTGWYASHPAEPVRGVCVSNMLQEGEPRTRTEAWSLPEGVVQPIDLRASVAACRRHTASIDPRELARYIPSLQRLPANDERRTVLTRQLARMHTVHQSALLALRAQPDWNAAMVFYETIDTVGHHFMRFVPPRMPHVKPGDVQRFGGVMDHVYETHDQMLGELLDAAGPETTVLLLSDHGFHSDHRRPVIDTDDLKERAAQEARWHRPIGVLAMSGPGVRAGAQPVSPSLLDIAPTALALLGLPAGRDMQGRVLSECLQLPGAPERIESWDAIHGDDALHPPEMRQDPFESHGAIQQLIDLGYMAAPSEGVRAQLELTLRETRFNKAVVLAFTGRAAEAVPILQELVGECPDEPRYRADLAKMLHAAGRHEACLEALAGLPPPNAEDTALRLMGATSLLHLGRLDAAARAVDAIQTGGAVPAEDLLQLGQLLTVLGQDTDIDVLAKAAAHDPDNPMVALAQARAALRRQRHEDVVDHTLRAAELRHALPEAHFLLGVSLAWLGDLHHACKSWEVTLSLQPGLVDAHRFLSVAWLAQGDTAVADRHGAKADELWRAAQGSAGDGEAGPAEAELSPWGWQALARTLGVQAG